MTPVSSPIREFGILNVEHGDIRVAARAGSYRTVRPAATSRTTRVERKPGKNAPRSRTASSATPGAGARASEDDGAARRLSHREHTRLHAGRQDCPPRRPGSEGQTSSDSYQGAITHERRPHPQAGAQVHVRPVDRRQPRARPVRRAGAARCSARSRSSTCWPRSAPTASTSTTTTSCRSTPRRPSATRSSRTSRRRWPTPGSWCPMATTNLFSDPAFKDGAFTAERPARAGLRAAEDDERDRPRRRARAPRSTCSGAAARASRATPPRTRSRPASASATRSTS